MGFGRGLPTALIQACGGAAVAALGLGVRWLINILAPDALPFAMTLPALIFATLFFGWIGGLACLFVGEAGVWILFARGNPDFSLATRMGWVNLGLAAVGGGAVIALASFYRRTLDRLRRQERQAAEDRQAALGRQLQLLDNAGSLICVLQGSDLRITYANRGVYRLFGRDDVVGRTLLEVLPVTPPDLVEMLRDVAATGRSAALTERAVELAEGDLRWFDLVCEPVRDAAGAPEGVFVEAHDVTRFVQARGSLEESETRLRLAAEAARVGVWEWRLDTGEMLYSAEAKAISGFPADQPVTYDMAVAATHPDDLPRTLAQAERALDPATRDVAPYEYRLVRADGERWVMAWGKVIFDEDEAAPVARRYIGVLIDITERKRAELALLQSERRLALAMDAGRMAVWRVERGVLQHSPGLNRLLGYPPDARPSAEELRRHFPGDELDRMRERALASHDRGDHFLDFEFRFRRPSGDLRWFGARAEVITGADGSATDIIGVLMDVTERKAADDRLRLLANEVNHRANNLLGVVQSMVRLSQATTMEGLRATITGRVHALARAHQLLSDTRWQGVGLHKLIEEELAPYRLGGPNPVTFDGPATELPPSASQGVAIALHELATNAVKYGALSTPQGRLDVTWDLAGETLTLRWREQGGPPVRPPERRGFGSTVLERSLAALPGGKTVLDWRPEGLICELSLKVQPEPASPEWAAGGAAGS